MKVCFTHVTSSGWPGSIFRQNLQNTNLLSTKLIFLFAKLSRLRYLLDLLEGKRSCIWLSPTWTFSRERRTEWAWRPPPGRWGRGRWRAGGRGSPRETLVEKYLHDLKKIFVSSTFCVLEDKAECFPEGRGRLWSPRSGCRTWQSSGTSAIYSIY